MKSTWYVWFLTIALTLSGCAVEEGSSSSERVGNESGIQEQPSTGMEKEEAELTLEEEHEFSRVEVPLIRVVDGDTIKVEINGKEENVRFLLIDTPETNHPRMNGPQPFGPEAKKFMEEFAEGSKVELELDVSERDRYGRVLAYVYINGISAQEELLQKGLARVAYIYPPNTRYVDRYQAIQKKAQAEGVGIWSVENYAQEDGFYPEYVDDPTSQKPKEEDLVTGKCIIKGNISSSGEKIYHVETGAYYERTIPEECFATEEEAKAAGYRKSKR